MAARAASYAGVVATRRAVEAARACDLDVAELVFGPDGTIRVIDVKAVKPVSSGDEFARWEAQL